MMLASCEQGTTDKDSAMQERDSLQRIINEKDLELNDIMGTFSEGQEGIRRINEAEGRIVVVESGPENPSGRDVIRENMQFIEKAMEQNRDMIRVLREKLETSSFKADKLVKTIENLQAQIDTQSQRRQELEASLAERDSMLAVQVETISSLTAENESKSNALSQQDKELNKAWFVFGTKSELKEEKILSDGDLLRDSSFRRDYFTQIDRRYDKVVKFYSKSAKVLSSHPTGSYQLVKDAQGQYELHIKQPELFWSVTRYLVVQVR